MNDGPKLSVLSRNWRPMSTAPKDGTEIQARGYNWGDKTRGRHRVLAYWNGSEWRDANDEDSVLYYLEEWRATEGATVVGWDDHSVREPT